MGRIVTLLTIVLVLVLLVPALAEWRVEIESKTVAINQTGVTLGMDMYWDAEINILVVPIVVREITPGSFWTGTLPCDTVKGVPQRVTWNWSNPDWASFIQEFRPGVGCNVGRDPYDGISPDNFVIAAVGIPGGAPAEPAGRRVLTIEFDVTGQPGQFEFDTACYAFPGGGADTPYLILRETAHPYTDHGPDGAGDCAFGKGIVTITDCYCPAQGDCDGDGQINLTDVAYLAAYAFHNNPAPIADPDCPAAHRGDWNADGRVNLIDIVSMVRYIFRDPTQGPVDPCLQ